MKTIRVMSAAFAATLSLCSSAAFAQIVTATCLTLDGAEAKIAAQARHHREQYRIIEASNGNEVHMTAELYK